MVLIFKKAKKNFKTNPTVVKRLMGDLWEAGGGGLPTLNQVPRYGGWTQGLFMCPRCGGLARRRRDVDLGGWQFADVPGFLCPSYFSVESPVFSHEEQN